MREIKSIVGLRVIAVDEGASVGTVHQVVVDLARGLVLGMILGEGPGERGVLASDIKTMGADAIMVTSRAVAKYLSELPELDSRKLGAGAQLMVYTASGKRLGVVSSIFIDPYDMVVTRYEVSSGPLKDLADGVLVLPILPGSKHGQDAVIVPDEQVQQLGREAGGWRGRFGQWSEGARKQAQQVSEQAAKLSETAGEAVKKEAKVVRDKAAKLSESAGETVKKEAQVVREKAAKLSESAGETVKKEAQVVREKAAKLSETAGEAVKKEAQVVREKAADLTAKTREAVTNLGEKEEAAPVEEGAPAEAAAEPAVEDQPCAAADAPAEAEAQPATDESAKPTEQ